MSAPNTGPDSKLYAFVHHGEEAQRAYLSLSDLPETYQNEFLKALDESPSANVDDLASFIRTKAKVHELSEDTGSEGASSQSDSDEAREIDDQSADISPPSPEKTDERVSALEAELRELSARADAWHKSAQSAAEDVQRRFVDLEAEMAGLRRERDDLLRKAGQVRKESELESGALRRELFLNGIAALIFLVGQAVMIAYLTEWPAAFWQNF